MNLIKPEDMAMEIGQRCRRVRMAKGLSQQQLADLAETTAQNISKYEKNGISDIFWIKKLSGILDVNLLDDEADQEGPVGEVGREILYTLVIRGGHEDTEDILSSEMYGYSKEKVSHEIYKLEKIGMVVRELFNGWLGVEEDVTFITAKGLITLKNMQLNAQMEKDVFNVIEEIDTYEQIVRGCNSYQDFIDKHPAEKHIRSIWYGNEYVVSFPLEGIIGITSDYRCNYVKWLKENYLEGFEEDKVSELSNSDQWIPSKSIYHDIIYRMALEITDETEWLHAYNDEDYVRNLREDFEMMRSLLPKSGQDQIKEKVEGWLTEELKIPDASIGALGNEDASQRDNFAITASDMVDYSRSLSEAYDVLLRYKEGKLSKEEIDELGYDQIEDLDGLMEKIIYWIDFCEYNLEINFEKRLDYAYSSAQEIYKAKASGKQSLSPTEWFTVDEIRDFINSYLGPAKTEEEKKLDQVLTQINELLPDTLEYYRFPKEWEQNGLADLVRKNHNVPTIPDDEEDADE